MADEQKRTAAAHPQPIKSDDSRKTADDDVVGKAYDGRLMRRLVRYLAPYKLQVAVSAVAIVLKAASDVLEIVGRDRPPHHGSTAAASLPQAR